jgi:hypothetical protein
MKNTPRSSEGRCKGLEDRKSGFQTLDEFRRRYFPHDFQTGTTVDSSEAVLHQVTEESAGIIKAAFAETR